MFFASVDARLSFTSSKSKAWSYSDSDGCGGYGRSKHWETSDWADKFEGKSWGKSKWADKAKDKSCDKSDWADKFEGKSWGKSKWEDKAKDKACGVSKKDWSDCDHFEFAKCGVGFEKSAKDWSDFEPGYGKTKGFCYEKDEEEVVEPAAAKAEPAAELPSEAETKVPDTSAFMDMSVG